MDTLFIYDTKNEGNNTHERYELGNIQANDLFNREYSFYWLQNGFTLKDIRKQWNKEMKDQYDNDMEDFVLSEFSIFENYSINDMEFLVESYKELSSKSTSLGFSLEIYINKETKEIDIVKNLTYVELICYDWKSKRFVDINKLSWKKKVLERI